MVEKQQCFEADDAVHSRAHSDFNSVNLAAHGIEETTLIVTDIPTAPDAVCLVNTITMFAKADPRYCGFAQLAIVSQHISQHSIC